MVLHIGLSIAMHKCITPPIITPIRRHYVIEGTPGTEYEGGWYWGKITFPGQYPYKPPSLILLTPNGRFATNTQLCLSMTSFHPEVCSA